MIQIKSKYDGFRRCGVAHTKAGQEFPDDFFTAEQIKQMENDPMITVIRTIEPEITEPEPEKTGKKTKSKGK